MIRPSKPPNDSIPLTVSECESLYPQYVRKSQARGISPLTLQWYKQKWQIWCEWLQVHREIDHIITQDDIIDFIANLPSRPTHKNYYHITDSETVSVHTVRGYFVTIRAILRGCGYKYLVYDLHPPRVPERQVDVITPNDMKLLLKAIDNRPKLPSLSLSIIRRLRDKAALMVLYDTGIRASELTNLRISDWNPETNKLIITRKGGRPDIVNLGAVTAYHLNTYVEVFKPTDLIFNGLTRSGLYQMVRRTFKDAGLPRRRVHDFRHSFACQFLQNGGSEFALKSLLGHKTMLMTNYYASHTQKQRSLEQHSQYSPGDRVMELAVTQEPDKDENSTKHVTESLANGKNGKSEPSPTGFVMQIGDTKVKIEILS